MSKEKFLHSLNNLLTQKNVKPSEKKQIIADYDDLYTQGLEQGLTDEEITEKLGSPEFIYRSLKSELSFLYKKDSIVPGIMVFISIVLFFLVGQSTGEWQYAWQFFLLIPLSAIISNVGIKKGLPGIMVFVSIITFFTLGMIYKVWHPLWLVFLSIPISAILVNVKGKNLFIGLLPFISMIIYFVVSYFYEEFYIYGWNVFFGLLILACFTSPITKEKMLMALSILIAIVLYLWIGFVYEEWRLALLVYLLPVTIGVLTGLIEIEVAITNILKRPKAFIITVTIIIIYVTISLVISNWKWTWTILLTIPMIAIYEKEKFTSIVPYTPFIALMLFYLVGYFVEGAFSLSWLFFLIIPVAAIIDDRIKQEKEGN